VKKAAQVLRLEVDLYRANAEGTLPDSTDCEGCGYIGMSTVIGARCPRCGSTPSPSAPAPSVEQPLSDAKVEEVMALVQQHGDYRWAHCIGGRAHDAIKAGETRKKIRALLQSAQKAEGNGNG
jgi:hypothetical protein